MFSSFPQDNLATGVRCLKLFFIVVGHDCVVSHDELPTDVTDVSMGTFWRALTMTIYRLLRKGNTKKKKKKILVFASK